MSLSEDLKKHLHESAKNGSRLAILFAQIALVTATCFFRKTRLYAEHDRSGFTTLLSYQIMTSLVCCSSHLSGLGFIRGTGGSKINSIANFICLILAIVLEKFYEKSLSSLGFALSITVLFLILLVIIRPSMDLGLFGFLIGIIGSVAYNLFGLKFQTWIVLAICFPLLGFRCWLDKNWLEVGEDQLLLFMLTHGITGGRNRISKSQIIEELTVSGFLVFLVYNSFSTNCRGKKEQPKFIDCTTSFLIAMSFLIFSIPGILFLGSAYLWERQTRNRYAARGSSHFPWIPGTGAYMILSVILTAVARASVISLGVGRVGRYG